MACRSLALLLLVLAPSGAAYAQAYEAPPAVSAQRHGETGQIRASMDVAAPPAIVWRLLSDCGLAQRYMRELISCRVLERGPGWDVREHRVRGWLLKPVMRNVSRVTLEPNSRVAFRRVAGDWTRSDGEWRLAPIDGGRGTRLEYDLEAALSGPLPASLAHGRLAARVRVTMEALRAEAEREAAGD